jgi:hypothetical protein
VRTTGIKALKNKLEEFFANWVFEWDFEKTELTKTVDGIYIRYIYQTYFFITCMINFIYFN